MEDYKRYSKEELIHYCECIDRPVKTFDAACLRLCELLSCENCPVQIYQCDKRTKEDRMNHEPCYGELYDWILSEAEKRLNEIEEE